MAFGKISPRSPGWWSAFGLFPHGTGIGSILASLTKRGRVTAIAPGTIGNVLTSNGSGSLPSYQAAASGGSANITPDTHPSTENTVNDEFEYGSAIDTAGDRFAGATGWTAFNTPSNSWNEQVIDGALNLVPLATGATNAINGWTQPINTTDWAYTIKVLHAASPGSVMGFILAGSSGASGKMYLYGFYEAGATSGTLYVQEYSNSTTFVSNVTDVGSIPLPIYLQVAWNGTDLIFSYSYDGITFIILESVSSPYVTPTVVGLGGINPTSSSGAPALNIDWFRKTT